MQECEPGEPSPSVFCKNRVSSTIEFMSLRFSLSASTQKTRRKLVRICHAAHSSTPVSTPTMLVHSNNARPLALRHAVAKKCAYRWPRRRRRLLFRSTWSPDFPCSQSPHVLNSSPDSNTNLVPVCQFNILDSKLLPPLRTL